MICTVCPRHCELSEGQTGACHARALRDGAVGPLGYGLLSSIALDPVEKKPLAHFHSGSMILSAGGFGCNLRCPFCQNCEISNARMEEAPDRVPREKTTHVLFTDASGRTIPVPLERVSPEELCELALSCRNRGNIGVAYTYNEPLVCYEYVRDTALIVHAAGMKNVLVTAGCISQDVLSGILPYMDAMNIDLKSFREAFYRDMLGGDLETVKAFIRTAAESGNTHVELTTLIIPGENDTDEEMREIASWIASLDHGKGRDIPLHVTRFFPRHNMTDRDATPVRTIYHLADVAREYLKFVYAGNC